MRHQERGFTVVEVVMIVTVIGILSSVFFFSFQHLNKKSKASEASVKLSHIASGAMAWFTVEKQDKAGKIQPPHFPHRKSPALPGKGLSRSKAPAGALCGSGTREGRYPIQQQVWKVSPWRQLKFRINHEHYFQYLYTARGAGKKSSFEAIARADLNCDGIHSFYKLKATTDGSGEVVRHPLVVQRGLE